MNADLLELNKKITKCKKCKKLHTLFEVLKDLKKYQSERKTFYLCLVLSPNDQGRRLQISISW